ncbi:MAG TPA: hypothetical protein VLD62_00020 [Acidimicrobiia bacterium]|nr:hypothetical protein [Acidimicrobiia bacterium]
MRLLRVMVLAGTSLALMWLAPIAAGVVGATLFVSGFGVALVTVGVAASWAFEAVSDPTARPMGRAERCRLCHARRLRLGNLWLCPVCDFADPEELGIDPRRRGGTAML